MRDLDGSVPSWWERVRQFCATMDPEYDPTTGHYAGELLWARRPAMVSDDAAARVAEVRHVLDRCVGTYQSVALSPQDAASWLAALGAAEAARDQALNRLDLLGASDVLLDTLRVRLDAAEAERDQARRELALQQGSFAAVVAERDAALSRQNRLERLLETVTLKHQDALERATRLAALEQECRAYLERHQFVDAGIVAAIEALDALAAPPGEGA